MLRTAKDSGAAIGRDKAKGRLEGVIGDLLGKKGVVAEKEGARAAGSRVEGRWEASGACGGGTAAAAAAACSEASKRRASPIPAPHTEHSKQHGVVLLRTRFVKTAF